MPASVPAAGSRLTCRVMTRHQFTKAALRIDTGIGDAEREDSGGEASHPSAHGHPPRCANLFRVAVRRYARVAEWQTRTVQVRVSERTWRFNSSLAHYDVWSPDYIKSPLTRTSVLLSCGLPWTRMAFRGLPFPTYSPRFPTYSPRHPGRRERRRRPLLSTRPSSCPLRSVTGGAHHG